MTTAIIGLVTALILAAASFHGNGESSPISNYVIIHTEDAQLEPLVPASAPVPEVLDD